MASHLRGVAAAAGRMTIFAWPSRRRSTLWVLAVLTGIAALTLGYMWRVDPTERGCTHVSCGIATNAVTSAALVILGYLAYLVKTRAWVLSRYLKAVRRDPFGTGAEQQASVAPRKELCRAIMDELQAGIIPLVQGPAGSGKTTFMRSLTGALADHGAVPIPIPLRGLSPPFDLRELARMTFHRRIEAWVSTDGEADRLWRQLYRGGHIVVLADALDEAVDDHPLTDLLRPDEPHRAAGRGRLAVVVASRPRHAVTKEEFSPFPLEPLELDWMVDELSDTTNDEPARARARGLLVALDAGRTPFYYEIARELLRGDGRPDLSGSTDQVRRRCLDAYVSNERGRPSALVEQLAEHMLTGGRNTITTTAARKVLNVPPELVDRELSALRSRGIVRVGTAANQETISFGHPIFAAYLTSKRWGGPGGLERAVAALDEKEPSEDLLAAVRLLCASLSDDEHRGVLLRALTSQAEPDPSRCRADEGLQQSGSMRALGAAAHAAGSAGEALADEVIKAIRRSGVLDERAIRADPPSAVVLIDGLADLARSHQEVLMSDAAYACLWEIISKGIPYAVSWRIVEAVVADPARGMRAIEGQVRDDLSTLAERLNHMPDKSPGITLEEDAIRRAPAEELIPRMETVAKFIPGVVCGLPADTSDADRVRAHDLLFDLVRMVRTMRGKVVGAGVEASLAQGFRLAAGRSTGASSAVLDATVDGEPLVESELAGSFWYARLNVVHAVLWRAIRIGQEKDPDVAARRRRREIVRTLLRASRDPHPFVRSSARLALRGVATARISQTRATAFVWGDEAAMAQHSGAELHPRAARLLGRVLLVLNMNEQRWPNAGGESRRRTTTGLVAESAAVPACVARADDAHRLASGEPAACRRAGGLRPCPYPPGQTGARPGAAYRPLSAAFCERQAVLERRWHRRLASLLTRRSNLADAWAEIERRTLAQQAVD